MNDPITASAAASATATVIGASLAAPILASAPAVVPQLVIFGFALGLRADVLVAGFAGALASIILLNAVPSTGDTLGELLRTAWRRMLHILASAVVAGYMTPVFMLLEGPSLRIHQAVMLGVAFGIGAGAQGYLRRWLKSKESKLAAAAGTAHSNGGTDAAG